MNDMPRQKLSELLAKHGHGLCDDVRRLEGLLKDVLRNEYKRETFVLINALREGVANELRGSTLGMPPAALAAKLARQLCDNLGLDDAVARWSVESWAVALGIKITLPMKPQRNDIRRLLDVLPDEPDLVRKFTNSVGMSFRHIPGGPTDPFSIGVHQVTQSQFQSVMGSNPSKFRGADNPVDQVRWDEAVAFCGKLSAVKAERAAGREYRLPTDAEWEYACRAGTNTAYSFGDDAKDLSKYAWFDENSGRTTHAVGGKLPNGWGLFDMHGNVCEWCLDKEKGWFFPRRFVRGGSWGSVAADCRTALRSTLDPTFRTIDLGFRLALSSVK